MGTTRVKLWVLFVVAAVVSLVAVVVQPSADAQNEIVITAAGDYSTTTNTASVLDTIGAIDPDVHMALGDLSYNTNPEDDWCSFVHARVGEGFPFELVAGNHESDGLHGSINNFSACMPNQIPGVVGTYGREYYADYPQGSPTVRVIGASAGLSFPGGTWNYTKGDAHYQFVANAIDAARTAGIPWVVVATHYPCLTGGVYGCVMPRDFFDLMLDKHVDLVLSGHEHGYMRTHQVGQGSTGCTALPTASFDADCVLDSDADMRAGLGTVFATVGTGGVPLRPVDTTQPQAAYVAAQSGSNLTPTYGPLQLTISPTDLTATFVRATGSNFADAFAIHRATTASFTRSINDLSVTVDGSGSSDPGGPITAYQWDFGDGATAQGGQPPAHRYATAGTYQISLTVTGPTGTATVVHPVTVTATPPVTVLAADRFERTVASGLGTAETGGPWSVAGSASNYSVSGGLGRIKSAALLARTALLNSSSFPAVDATVDIGLDKRATGGGTYTSVIGRANTSGSYRAKVRFQSDGSLLLNLIRTSASGTETALTSPVTVPGQYAAGQLIRVRVRIVGASPTDIRAKVWAVGTAEPAGWQATRQDSTTGLQTAGTVGIYVYTSSSATEPVTALIDGLSVTVP